MSIEVHAEQVRVTERDGIFDQAFFVGEQPVDFENSFGLLQGIIFFFSQPGAAGHRTVERNPPPLLSAPDRIRACVLRFRRFLVGRLPPKRASTAVIRSASFDSMSAQSHISLEEAKAAGEQIGIDWQTSLFDVEQFRMGMNVELEHGTQDPATDVTGDDPIVTAKIALAHLNEFADYYTRLAVMEAEGEAAQDA